MNSKSNSNQDFADNINILAQLIRESNNTVFFGGAGVSTESGIPDFRSEAGLYKAQQVYGYPPEELLSYTFFKKKTELFFQYYRENLIAPDVKPNAAHIALAHLEHSGKLQVVITQNIDGLHQSAGSKNVLELHGSNHRQYCMDCKTEYTLEYILERDTVPRCEKCDGIIRPDVVLYEEQLDSAVIEASIEAISRAELLIVGGTSLSVYPAAGLLRYFRGSVMVLINKTETQADNVAQLVIHDSIGKVLEAVAELV